MSTSSGTSEFAHPYLLAFRGSLVGMRQWRDLDELWETLRDNQTKQWYVYAMGEPVPTSPLPAQQLNHFINEIDSLLHAEHEEEYCGIVYADDKNDPQFIKIYDPNNLGVVCGYSDNPPLPGWTLSTCRPVEINQYTFIPQNRKRWWKRIFTKN